MGTLSLAGDIILDWIADDGYSLSEAVWIPPQDQQFYFEVTAEKGGPTECGMDQQLTSATTPNQPVHS